MTWKTNAWRTPASKENRSPDGEWCVQCGKERRPTQAVGWDEDGEPACVDHRAKPEQALQLTKPIELPPVVAEPLETQITRKEEPQMPITVNIDIERARAMHEAGVPLREMANELGVAISTVSRKLKEAGVTGVRGRPKTDACGLPNGKGQAHRARSISENRGYILSLNSGEVDRLLQSALARLDTDQKVEVLRDILLR